MSATEIESARQDLPARVFEQEYLARFVHDIGAVFANLALVSTLQEDRRPSGAGTGRRLVFGIDWGRDVDFTVVCVLDAATRRQVALERFRHISWEQQRARVGALYREFMPEVIIAERNASDYMIESLISDGLPVTPFTTSQQSKMNIIDALAVAIENQWLTLLDHNVQKNELSSFTLSRLPGGGYAYSAPPGMHDDTVMALAFAWRGVTQAAVPQGIMRQMEVNW
jgi:phage FluMu gp28-like protein